MAPDRRIGSPPIEESLRDPDGFRLDETTVAGSTARVALDAFFWAPDLDLTTADEEPLQAAVRHVTVEEDVEGRVRIDGFAPFMLAGLSMHLCGPAAPDDPHAILHFLDPEEPRHREGLDERFPQSVMDRAGIDLEVEGWIFWRVPDPLRHALSERAAAEDEELAKAWNDYRCLWWFRGSYDLAMARPPLTEVLAALRSFDDGPLWMGWRGEA